MDSIDVKRVFLYDTIPDIQCKFYSIDYLKFVFDIDTMKELTKLVKTDDLSDKICYERGINSITYLYNNFKNCDKNDDIYIKVNDSFKFFELLSKIVNKYNEKDKRALSMSKNIIRSIWLRMGIEDIENVEAFLEKQLSFLESDDFIDDKPIMLFENSDISLYCKSSFNDDWFETNNHIEFYFENDNRGYALPVIHYGLSKENDDIVCYIYGIQNLNYYKEKDEKLSEYLKDIKKPFRNKYVSKDFILALTLFMDFIQSYGITDIRVPIFQVFNYDYHSSLSNEIKTSYDSYENKEELERLSKMGSLKDIVLDYEYDKKVYDKFVGKEDLISKNKTERLIETFMSMEDSVGNIEIINEPFIQGDELIVKIKNKSNIIDMLCQKSK